MELDAEFPEYGFAGHKGCGTKKHLETLHKHGATPAIVNPSAPLRCSIRWVYFERLLG